MDNFFKKIEDLYNRAINRNVLTYTNFLTPAERETIRERFKTNVCFLGGNENSERVRAFFMPDYIENIQLEEYIVAFKVKFSFNTLSHRDFLGTILGLGIKRECIGDIYVFEKEAYFFATRDISEYIKLNLTKVGSTGINLIEVSFSDVKVPEEKFNEVKFTVQSLRLDSILAGTFKESRENMNLNIRDGIVYLNYLICQNVSEHIKQGDIISVKGYGKAKIKEIGGQSRSGKIFVVSCIYV